jgi:RNA-directed DNA polymerase
LQHALYRAAKADPGRRFPALYDKVRRRDVLWRAWVMVRSSNGAPGIDRTTLAAVEEYGVTRLLDELASELGEGRYRPVPARRVYIPKPGVRGEQRPLSIPSVRDRIVQAAVKIVLEPVFEADFLPCSFGFRPRLSAHDALQVLVDEGARGRRWVVETDIASCFSAIPHERLMEAVEERICDQPVLKLLRAMLRAGVIEDGQVRREAAGTPQGGVFSPVMCNVYLHRLDRAWDDRDGVLCRYADLCRARHKSARGYPFNRSSLDRWSSFGSACITRGQRASSRPGSGPTRTAWTTWSGCAGRAVSSVRAAGTGWAGGWVMAASNVPGAVRGPR